MKKLNKIQSFLAEKLLGIKPADLKVLSEVQASIDNDDYLYRRSNSKGTKGLNPITRDRQDALIYKMFLTNGMVKRILEIILDFVFGDGFTYKFSVNTELLGIDKETEEGKKRVEEIIKECKTIADEFWKKNKMDFRFEKHYQDLRLYGRLLETVFVNPVNGAVRLGYIDVTNIDKVICNPENIEEIQHIQMKGQAGNGPKRYKVIQENYDINNERFSLLDGECFFHSINNVSNQPEGVSDFLSSADYLDVMDNVMFKTLDLLDAQTTYIEDVTIQGGEKEVKDYEKADRKHVGHLAKRYHNEKVTHEYLAPDIKAAETTDLIRMVKNFALGTQGLPEHWFADGGNTNLATATEQTLPTLRKMRKIQKFAVDMLIQLLTFCLHQAFEKRQGFTLTLEELNAVVIDVNRPELEPRQFDKIGKGLTEVFSAIAVAVTNKWISNETAGYVTRAIFDMVGHEIDDDTEMQKIEAEKSEAEAEAKKNPENQNKNNNGEKNKTEGTASDGSSESQN